MCLLDRYLGNLAPDETFNWQDPLPQVDHDLIDDRDIAGLKAKLLDAGLSVFQLVATAWASAATFRGSDKRGGANGARIRLAPMKDWEFNQPRALASARAKLGSVRDAFNAQSGGKKVSPANLIVLDGCAAVEKAGRDASHDITVPFALGRTDATPEQTGVESIAWLEPTADGFCNYVAKGHRRTPQELLVDRAQLLTLSASEMTVLVGGLRVLVRTMTVRRTASSPNGPAF